MELRDKVTECMFLSIALWQFRLEGNTNPGDIMVTLRRCAVEEFVRENYNMDVVVDCLVTRCMAFDLEPYELALKDYNAALVLGRWSDDDDDDESEDDGDEPVDGDEMDDDDITGNED